MQEQKPSKKLIIKSNKIAHSCINRERDTGCHTCDMCNDAELHKMELPLKKILLTFVPIQSGDISVHRLFQILLQPSVVTSSSDKRR